MREAIEAIGARFLDLPLYSPDFDPIEQVIAKTKVSSGRLQHEPPTI